MSPVWEVVGVHRFHVPFSRRFRSENKAALLLVAIFTYRRTFGIFSTVDSCFPCFVVEVRRRWSVLFNRDILLSSLNNVFSVSFIVSHFQCLSGFIALLSWKMFILIHIADTLCLQNIFVKKLNACCGALLLSTSCKTF